eukprot:CAMPEP_0170380784 /NCGR_PEP_ID=MMETSP0117_2-20130122/14063_1 /TAXON_ID=400756 /ORGANISM="Durinskia baltica, Strain CSIRO CS-38" /LENGTH=748 /DNA_ID=CAMNT_0010636317 /DNA_START=399 /DNA_END=2645 /DNA_ORIENTATION=-
MIRLQHGIDEDGLRALFKLSGYVDKFQGKKGSAKADPPMSESFPGAELLKEAGGTRVVVTSKVSVSIPSAVQKPQHAVPAETPFSSQASKTSSQNLMLPNITAEGESSSMLSPDTWSLSLDTNVTNDLGGMGRSYLGQGGGLNYDSLLNDTLSDNNRWALPTNDSQFLCGSHEKSALPSMPALIPASARHGNMSTLSLIPPLNGIFNGNQMINQCSSLGGPSSLNLLGNTFDALSLTSNVSSHPTPQTGFGSTLGGLSDTFSGSSVGVSLTNPLSVHLYQQAFEVVNGDEFNSLGTLRVTLTGLVCDFNGVFTTKGAFITHRGIQEVAVRSWRKSPANVGLIDTTALIAEIRALRIISRRTKHITRVLHHGILELTSKTSVGVGGDYLSLVVESGEVSTLDWFTSAQQSAVQSSNLDTSVSVYPIFDLQSICVQLIEGLSHCHEMNIFHRDICPSNILVCRCSDEAYCRQFNRGLVVKYTNFVPKALLPLCAQREMCGATSVEQDRRWFAPEVDHESRTVDNRFQACSDVWSLGLVLYFLASGGKLPFESHKQACEAAANSDLRRRCLEKHQLHERIPMLYDLVERLVRPVNMRTDLQIIRCHPFLWSMELRKTMLIQFANSTMLRNNKTINALVMGIDKISPLYVFGSDGWVTPMAPFLSALLPTRLKTELGWSGTYLLQAIKDQLSRPDLLVQSVYPHLTAHQATHAYIRQITDVDFPRLLILLYELGGIHGKWNWDGDDISHGWN